MTYPVLRAPTLTAWLLFGAAAPAAAEPVAFDLVGGTSQGLISFEVATAGGVEPAAWGPGDWFGVAAYGAWPQSAGLPFALADDSVADISGAGSFAGDTQGIIDSSFDAAAPFLGVVDTINASNSGDSATATWTFDIAGATDLVVAIDMAAMGDFEASNDSYVWSYAIDGGSSQTLFESAVNEAASQTYTMESGTPVTLDDPLVVNGIVLNDGFQTLVGAIGETGDTLTLTFTATADGGSEAYAATNIVISDDGDSGGNPGPAGVLLNEVLGSTTGNDVEFIELYNAGPTTVDLTNWSIELWESDAGQFGAQDADAPYALEAGAVIEAGGFYLLANPLVAGQYGVNGDQALPPDAIENGSYTIVLRNAAGEAVNVIFVTDGGDGDMANIDGAPVEPDATVGPDGSFLPAGFFRSPEAGGTTLLIQDFFLSTGTPTPGVINVCVAEQSATIPELQGAGHVSPFLGADVESTGVVTAVVSGSFYLQDPIGDADDLTSDAIVVRGAGVAVGDAVTVIGTVSEEDPAGGRCRSRYHHAPGVLRHGRLLGQHPPHAGYARCQRSRPRPRGPSKTTTSQPLSQRWTGPTTSKPWKVCWSP